MVTLRALVTCSGVAVSREAGTEMGLKNNKSMGPNSLCTAAIVDLTAAASDRSVGKACDGSTQGHSGNKQQAKEVSDVRVASRAAETDNTPGWHLGERTHLCCDAFLAQLCKQHNNIHCCLQLCICSQWQSAASWALCTCSIDCKHLPSTAASSFAGVRDSSANLKFSLPKRLLNAALMPPVP